MWWAASYIMTNDEQSNRGMPGYIEGVEPLSGSALAGLAALILVFLIGFIACAVTGIAFIISRVRGR
jgi:hypothetical protein